MTLEKKDFDQIELMFEKFEKRINKQIQISAELTKKELRQEIKTTVSGAENRIITVINREVGDLAEINRAVIQKVAKIDELEKRIIRLEHKAGITS